MKRPSLLLLFVLGIAVLAACGGDTAGNVAQQNNDAEDTGVIEDAGNNNGVEDSGNNGVEDMPPGPTSCDSNGDCTAPEVCLFDLSTGEGTCGTPTGTGQTGDACTTGADCQSGLCINGMCADPCSSESDCPAGYTCQPTQVPLTGGGTATIDVCVPEVTVCASDNDCTDPELCVVDRSGADVTLECGPAVGPGALGDACANDAECASNLCIDGLCSAPCEVANDCATDGSFVCEIESLTTGGGNADLTVCKPRPADQCLSDADCAGGERCVASKTATDVEFTCGTPNAGGGEVGATCATDADCAQNLCIGGTCSGPCQGLGDCASGQDYSCRVENVDLGNGNTDSAQICVAPTTCDDPDDCRTAMGEVCYVRENPMDIDLLCRQPNVGGGSLGQVCLRERECASNFCLETRFRDVCATPCADDTDCAVAGYECQTTTIDLAGGGTDDVSLCVPSTPPACSSEADCGTGLDCVIIENAAGTALESVCVPSTGGQATGVACMADDDCASLVCLNGFCAAPCTDDTQCTQGQLCLANDITKGTATGNFEVCETLGDQLCTSSDDCTDGVRVCSDVRDVAGTDTAYCEFPNNAGQQLGSACTMFGECRENICLAGLSNECSVVCDKDADCAATQGCTTFGDLNYCTTTCADSGDCAARNLVCTINRDVQTNDIDQICTESFGATDLGGTCTTGGDCVTGICLTTYIFNNVTCTQDSDCNTAAGEECSCPLSNPGCTTGKECASLERRCTEVCDDNSDCAGGIAGNQLTSCNPNIFVTRPDGVTSKNISACSSP